MALGAIPALAQDDARTPTEDTRTDQDTTHAERHAEREAAFAEAGVLRGPRGHRGCDRSTLKSNAIPHAWCESRSPSLLMRRALKQPA